MTKNRIPLQDETMIDKQTRHILESHLMVKHVIEFHSHIFYNCIINSRWQSQIRKS